MPRDLVETQWVHEYERLQQHHHAQFWFEEKVFDCSTQKVYQRGNHQLKN